MLLRVSILAIILYHPCLRRKRWRNMPNQAEQSSQSTPSPSLSFPDSGHSRIKHIAIRKLLLTGQMQCRLPRSEGSSILISSSPSFLDHHLIQNLYLDPDIPKPIHVARPRVGPHHELTDHHRGCVADGVDPNGRSGVYRFGSTCRSPCSAKVDGED